MIAVRIHRTIPSTRRVGFVFDERHALDGQLVAFPQTGGSVTSLPIPVTAGSNDGAAGIGFGDELNSGLIGGQRAANLVVSAYR
jgi:hypothetical protein